MTRSYPILPNGPEDAMPNRDTKTTPINPNPVALTSQSGDSNSPVARREDDNPVSPKKMGTKKARHEEKLAEALRANLRRRKAAAKDSKE